MNISKVIRSGRGRSGQVVRSGVFQVVRSGRGRSGQVAAGHGKVYFQVRDPYFFGIKMPQNLNDY